MKETNMLVSMTLNPAIDKMLEIEEFRYGEMNRVDASLVRIAGKGYHVAMSYQILGGSSFCLGFSFRNNRAMTEKYFLQNSLPNEFVEVQGDLRVNVKLKDRSTGRITEINDRGTEIGKKDLAAVFDLFRKYIPECGLFVLTGSLPPGVPPDVYRDMISEALEKGKISVLDAEGVPLLKGIESKPYLVKANIYEIERTFGIKITDEKGASAVCREINRMGVKIACVTLGEGGAVISDSDRIFSAAPPEGLSSVVSTVGAGDAFLGAVCREIALEKGADEMLRSGLAAASARVTNTDGKYFDFNRYEIFRERIEVKEI